MTETWWDIFTNPPHIIAELLWTLIQDVIIGWFFYGIIWKKYVFPKLRRDIHREIDEEHGVTHDSIG